MKLKAVIIDDEKDAIETLSIVVEEFCENVEIVGSASTIKNAIYTVLEKKPDIVFLDIEMPEMNGFDLLKLLPTDTFSTIFVTAYNKYAIEAFKVNAIDYILKPVNINELKLAIKKVTNNSKKINETDIENIIKQINNNTKIQIASIDGIEYIDTKDIIYISADKSYAIIHLENRTIISSKNLKQFEEKIPNKFFYRIHNSYFINLNNVIKLSYKDGAKIQMSNGQEIPISRQKRQDFLKIMETLFG